MCLYNGQIMLLLQRRECRSHRPMFALNKLWTDYDASVQQNTLMITMFITLRCNEYALALCRFSVSSGPQTNANRKSNKFIIQCLQYLFFSIDRSNNGHCTEYNTVRIHTYTKTPINISKQDSPLYRLTLSVYIERLTTNDD